METEKMGEELMEFLKNHDYSFSKIYEFLDLKIVPALDFYIWMFSLVLLLFL